MLEIVHGNRDDERYLALINGLMGTVFGFSFTEWHAMGMWDDRYECYSAVEGDRLMANVSVSRMQLIIGGQRIAAIQIGAVATAPPFRGQGLSRRLMEYVLDRYRGTPAFLVAHEGVLDFYSKFGFRQIREVQPYVRLAMQAPSASRECRQVAPDSPVLASMVANRVRLSAIVDAVGAASINWFHLITEFRESVYYMPGPDAIVVAGQEGSTMLVYDVLCSSGVPLTDLLGLLPFRGVETAEFAFTPDWLCSDYQTSEYRRADSWGYLLARNLDFGTEAKFPYMATT